MTTIKLPIEIESLLDSVLYAGAFSTYPWYTKFRETALKTRTYAVGIAVDGEEHVEYISEARLVEVVESIVSQRLPRHADIIHAIREDDIDAELADVILQYAILDDIVLG
jgi:hypothetical protein